MKRYTPLSAMKAINKVFLNLSPEEKKDLLRRQRPLSLKHGVSMFTPSGKPRIIDVHLRPWMVSQQQYRFFYQAVITMRGALSRMMPLYVADPTVRQILPLEPSEHEWMIQANAAGLQKPQTVIDRLDATMTCAASDWRNDFWFLEPNSVGIGGVHYIPACSALVHEWTVPIIKKHLPHLTIKFQDDIRELLVKAFFRHARGIGRKLRQVALVEDCSVSGGTDEFSHLADYFSRRGVRAMACDPRQIRLKKNELTIRGKVVDIIYRDTEITELFEMGCHKKFGPIDGMRQAFLRNQVVSSIGGEFDHKSAWELFTNPLFAKFFTVSERKLFRKHVLWTRLIWERTTTNQDGTRVDLASYIRRHREKLVLKPNRAYGGEGVLFGNRSSVSAWERLLGHALKNPLTHVVQQSVPVHSELFPVISPKGPVTLKPFYAVSGLAATPDGMAVLGRASREMVVNVSRNGGLIAVFQLL